MINCFSGKKLIATYDVWNDIILDVERKEVEISTKDEWNDFVIDMARHSNMKSLVDIVEA